MSDLFRLAVNLLPRNETGYATNTTTTTTPQVQTIEFSIAPVIKTEFKKTELWSHTTSSTGTTYRSNKPFKQRAFSAYA